MLTDYLHDQKKDFTEGDLIFIAPGVYHTMEVFDDNSIVFNILLRKSTFSQMFIPLMKGNNLLNEFSSEGLYHSQQIDYVIFHSGGEHLIDSQKEMLNVYHEHLFHDAFSDQGSGRHAYSAQRKDDAPLPEYGRIFLP